MTLRPATPAELSAVIALLAGEDEVVGPARTEVGEAHERAFAAITGDPRNELLVLVEGERAESPGEADGTVLGCLQATCIPGLGKGGAERALIAAVRVRADRRGGGRGRALMERAVERARDRGCALVQLTSDKRRADAHRFSTGLGFTPSHEGFRLALPRTTPAEDRPFVN
ncbi:GNAT family N-acetyltransferase [Streptomyces sp. KE1]|uniref:GNAT family N-acetyltransferase n=1 Tax=Streptomyces sp. KE1 TaxID=1638939 RepID=UPI00063E88DD|nr:GNAT family N-acetyltransferase [Streptomyces sp. KE1]KLJ05141.1 hypothetical protein WQ59_00700 [Streptomyces sp. KE1]